MNATIGFNSSVSVASKKLTAKEEHERKLKVRKYGDWKKMKKMQGNAHAQLHTVYSM